MSKHYQISVVTPVHNVDLKFFANTIKSMQNQTFGFENIEWVIVVHNCSADYQKEITAMLDKYENVKLHILNNDNHTASSPRNYALNYVTGDYVGFLDGDDKYTPECIKVALSNSQAVNADICLFRREVELESVNSLIMNEKVLWDQTQERIIVNKDTWDDKKLFNGLWGVVTHKLYKREFLETNKLRYNEELTFTEDFELTIRAFNLAQTICLLPQLIGYVYFINGGSLIQSSTLPSEKLINYSKNFKYTMDLGLKCGINMNYTMHLFLNIIALFMMHSKPDRQTRETLQEMLAPYVKMLKPIEPSRLYSEQRRHELNTIPYTILDEEKDVDGNNLISYQQSPSVVNVKDLQSMALTNIIENGENSDYGQRYHFDSILTMEGWTSRLPLTNYDTYQPMINLSIRIDESGIFTDNEISAYALSYGHLGTSKRLPFTQKHLRSYVKEFKNLIKQDKVFMMLESMPYHSSELTLDRTYTNTLTGIILSEIQKQGITNVNDRLNIVNPVELLFPDEVLNADYVRLFFALRERDIEIIYAPNAWTVLSNLELMFENAERLCRDIEAGYISETENFPESLRYSLNKRILPDKKRANELCTIFKDNPAAVVRKLWPKLKKVICNCTGSYMIYADNLRTYLAGVELANSFIATEEALVGLAREDKFELALNAAFFEFMPLGTDKVLYAHQLEVGGIYHVIVSTLAGLYRYSMNLIIKVEAVTDKSIVFTNVCDRIYNDVTEEDVYKAVKNCGLDGEDFVLFQNDDDENYTLILEPVTDAGLKIGDADKIAADVSNSLGLKVSVMFNEPKTHILYRELLQYKRNILPDAVKPVHITYNPSAIKFFRKMTVK